MDSKIHSLELPQLLSETVITNVSFMAAYYRIAGNEREQNGVRASKADMLPALAAGSLETLRALTKARVFRLLAANLGAEPQ